MTEAKHTPGPWRAYRLANYTDPGWVIIRPDTSKPGVHHRRVDYKGNFLEEDARLIAAAPELLSLLEGAVEIFGPNLKGGDDEWLTRARAAIAKALDTTS